MGSRTKPNLGGSGKPVTRKDWVIHKRNPKPLLENSYFKTIDDVNLYLSTVLILCLECGQDCRSLGHHLSAAHSMTSKQYKIKYNIPVGRSLKCESSRKLQSDAMKNVWKQYENPAALKKAISDRAKINLVGVGTVAKRTAIYEKPIHKKKCLTCNKEFLTINKYELSQRKYCSKKCHVESPEERAKLKLNAKKAGDLRAKTGKRNEKGVFIKKDKAV